MNEKQFSIDDDLLATHGQRIANYIIDNIICSVIFYGVLITLAISQGYQGIEIIKHIEAVPTLIQYSISLGTMLIYYNFMEIFFAVTVSKLITSTIVVNEFGEKPDVNAILMRSICRAIPFEFLTFLGMPCLGWHDRFSETYVVKKELFESRKRQFTTFSESKTD